MLNLKYKVLLCEPKIELNNFAGGKALETDHRDSYINIDVVLISKLGNLTCKISVMKSAIVRRSKQKAKQSFAIAGLTLLFTKLSFQNVKKVFS